MGQFCKTVSLGITGASGAPYALRLIDCLIKANVRVYLMISKPGQVVMGMETDLKLPARSAEIQRFLSSRYAAAEGQLQVFGQDQWTAPIASGSGVADAMVICPCTTGSLSAIACGASRSLLERAADVTLKERRPLLVVLREMPLSEIHLENMLKLVRMGVVMLPATPGFYHRPESVNDLVDFVVARILEHLGLDQQLLPSWGMDNSDSS